MRLSLIVAGCFGVVVSLAVIGSGEEPRLPASAQSQPATAGAHVTLKGILMGSDRCARPGEPEEKSPPVPILFAFEGAPEVSAAVQDIFKELFAGNSINYEQSKTIEEEMHKRLKYYLTIGDVTEAVHGKAPGWGGLEPGQFIGGRDGRLVGKGRQEIHHAEQDK
jgi:hypothetical protein